MRTPTRALTGLLATALLASGLAGVAIATQATAVPASCPSPSANFAGGDGSSGNPWQIGSASDLMLLQSTTTHLTENFILTGDIDLASCSWTGGIGSVADQFTGSFDGDGHSITNINVAVTGDHSSDITSGSAGLFGMVSGDATIKNLVVTGTVSADITGTDVMAYAAGIAGRADHATFDHVAFSGSATAHSSANHPYAGGIVAQGSVVSILSSSATASISATQVGRAAAGGLAGALDGPNFTDASVISDSWAVGSVYAFGISAQSSSGGLLGWGTRVIIARSFAQANVEAGPALEPAAGGLVGGGLVSISNSFARGHVTSPRFLGGLVGWLQQREEFTVLENSYAADELVTTSGNVGGLVGFADYQDPQTELLAAGSAWSTTTTGVNVAAGINNAHQDPVPVAAGGAQGLTTAQLGDVAVYSAESWDIAAGFDAAVTWGICATYDDGLPFLTNAFSSDPCTGSATASLSPATASFSGDNGASVSLPAYSVSGFVNTPVFSVSPALPSGVSMDPFSGAITGDITGYLSSADFTVRTFAGPYLQSASAQVTMDVSPPPTGHQVTNYALNDGNDGNLQATASRPDGSTLMISYGQESLSGTTTATLTSYLLDPSGTVVSTARVGGDTSAVAWGQPSIAYNPVTEGWLMCAARTTTDPATEPMCQYLNPDGTPVADAFAVTPEFPNDPWDQTAIAYSPVRQQFLVAATAWTSGAVGRFVAADGSGVVGDPINFVAATTPTMTAQGGVDLAYSTVSDTFALVVRAKQSGSHQFAPWVYLRAGDGTPLSGHANPVRITSDTSQQFSNGSIAYDPATNAFMLVSFTYVNGGPIWTKSFDSATGATSAAVSTDLPSGFNGNRFRPLIAADAQAGGYKAVIALVSTSDNAGRDFVLPIDDAGIAGELTLLAGSQAEPAGPRPRLTFRAALCDFVASYQLNTTASGRQAFVQYVPGGTTCGSASPTPSPTPTDTATPTPTDTASPTASPTSTSRPAPTATSKPSLLPTVKPTATQAALHPVVTSPNATSPQGHIVAQQTGTIAPTSVTVVPTALPRSQIVTVRQPLSTTPASAPMVTVRVGATRSFAVTGLKPGTQSRVSLQTGGKSTALGTVRSTRSGAAKLPGLHFSQRGTATLALKQTGSPTLYLRVKVG